MFYSRSPAHAYRKVGIESDVAGASPHRLVKLLYDGAIGTVRAAREHLRRGDVPAKCAAIVKAIRLVDEGLKAGLDPAHGGPIAGQLASIYDYLVARLLRANLDNDAKALEEVEGLLAGLREAWIAIDPDAPGRNAPPPRPILAGGLVAA